MHLKSVQRGLIGHQLALLLLGRCQRLLVSASRALECV